VLLRLPYLLIQSLARRSNRKTQLASGCFFNPSLKLSRQAHHLPAPQISRVSGRPCAVGTVVLRSGYRRRPRRIHRGINSDSSLEMQTKPLLSKGSRKPNASDLMVRHPHSHLRDRVACTVPSRDEAPSDTSIFPADSGLRSVAADAFHSKWGWVNLRLNRHRTTDPFAS